MRHPLWPPLQPHQTSSWWSSLLSWALWMWFWLVGSCAAQQQQTTAAKRLIERVCECVEQAEKQEKEKGLISGLFWTAIKSGGDGPMLTGRTKGPITTCGVATCLRRSVHACKQKIAVVSVQKKKKLAATQTISSFSFFFVAFRLFVFLFWFSSFLPCSDKKASFPLFPFFFVSSKLCCGFGFPLNAHTSKLPAPSTAQHSKHR